MDDSPQPFPEKYKKNLAFYQSSRFLSHIAFQIQSVAVGWQVYDLTHSALDLGIVGLVQFLPIILFSIPAGSIADKFKRKSISLVGLFISMLCSLALFFQTLYNPNVYAFYVILFLFATTRAFSGPANQSLLPDLVPRHLFPKAVALNSSLWQLAFMVGPMLGGFIYGGFGHAKAAYLTAALCLAVGFMLQFFVHAKESHLQTPPTKDTLFAGLRYVWTHKSLLGAISLDLFAVLFGGAVALLPAFAKDVLTMGPEGLGLLRSAPGLGAAITAFYLTRFPIEKRAGAKMFWAVAIFGIATIGFGLSRNFWLSFFFLFVTGVADIVSVVVRGTLTQIETPHSMRGRVSAVNLVFISASNELGEFESGITAQFFGLIPSVVIGGIGTVLVAILWSYLFPTLRKLDNLTTR